MAWQRLKRFRKSVEFLQAHFGPQPAETLLDVGAADGIGMPYWQSVSRRVISVNHRLSYCMGFTEAWPDKELLIAEGQKLPFRDRSIAAVVCLETLHLLPTPAARLEAMAEIRRVLKPDGLFVCSVAIEVGLPAVIKYAGRRASGIVLHGMTFGLMLKHCFHPLFDVSRHDQGHQLGFNAYRFAGDFARYFTDVRRARVPLPYPLSTNYMLVGRPRPD